MQTLFAHAELDGTCKPLGHGSCKELMHGHIEERTRDIINPWNRPRSRRRLRLAQRDLQPRSSGSPAVLRIYKPLTPHNVLPGP